MLTSLIVDKFLPLHIQQDLSGGERNHVQLATLLKSGANIIILDKPTNDLDVETLRSLEEALLNFAGCAVVVSHDRYFLDRIATHILAFEGDSNCHFFEGNYADYEENQAWSVGAMANNYDLSSRINIGIRDTNKIMSRGSLHDFD